MAREKILVWAGGGLLAASFAAALALWALYGPLVFVQALNAVWTCM